MDVQIVDFPETRVAAVEHRGPPEWEHRTAQRLIEWRRLNQLRPDRHRTYGVHYTNPYTTPPADHRVDFCVSVDFDRDFPIFVHYVTVGPDVQEHEMITDVYLPLR